MRDVVSTPAGRLEFACQVDDQELLLKHRRHIQRGEVENWTIPGRVDITFVRAKLEPPRWGSGPPVDVYLGAVWTVIARRPCGPLDFGAHLTDPEAHQHIDASPGEAVEAVTYDRPGLSLSIGTHDDETLATRAKH